MQIDSEFALDLPPKEVFPLLLDIELVAPCLPGCELGARAEDGSYAAGVIVKLGPMRLSYDGTVAIVERHDSERSAVLLAKARESRGNGTAEARITMHVGGDDRARVSFETELILTGRPAQMGKGIIEEVARRLVGEMAACLETRLAPVDGREPLAEALPASPARPVGAAKLLLAVLWARVRRLVERRR